MGEGGCSRWFPARYQLAILSFLGFANVYMLRVNLSVAIVSMVSGNSTHTSSGDECPTTDSANSSSTVTPTPKATGPHFDWDRDTQGLVLGSFFYGYFFTQIPGGWLGGKYGGKQLFGLGVLCTAIFTILTPWVAEWNVNVLIVVRILEGLGEGVTFPAMTAMWAEWAPPLERSKLITLSYGGAQFGTVIGLPLAGLICDRLGWPSVFWIFGAIGVVWYVLWVIFTSNTPEQHRWITEEEKTYIITSVEKEKSKNVITLKNTPWLSLFTSAPVWGIIIAHFCHNWGFYTLLTCLPTFMSDVLHFNLSNDALISAIPYLTMWITVSLTGVVVDMMRARRLVKTGLIRKIVLAVGLMGPAACLVGVGYVGCEYNLAVVLLCIAGAFDGISQATSNVNQSDIAPKYAGTLFGITNTVATIPGFLAPQVVGWITDKNSTSSTWREVFYISAEIYIFGVILFSVLGSGEVQSWAKDSQLYETLPEDTTCSEDDNSSPKSDSSINRSQDKKSDT